MYPPPPKKNVARTFLKQKSNENGWIDFWGFFFRWGDFLGEVTDVSSVVRRARSTEVSEPTTFLNFR